MDSYFCVYVYFFLLLCVFKLFFSFRLNVAGTFCRNINARVCWCFGTFVFSFFFAFFNSTNAHDATNLSFSLFFFSPTFYSFKPTKCFHNWCALTVVLVEKLLSFSHRKHTLIPCFPTYTLCPISEFSYHLVLALKINTIKIYFMLFDYFDIAMNKQFLRYNRMHSTIGFGKQTDLT